MKQSQTELAEKFYYENEFRFKVGDLLVSDTGRWQNMPGVYLVLEANVSYFKMFSTHSQTIRYFERGGWIKVQ
jgi:hypothetical protein